MWSSTSVLLSSDMPSLPSRPVAHRAQPRGRRVRRDAARDRPRAEIRQAAFGRAPARCDDDGRREGRVARRRRCNPGPAALDAEVAAGIQPGVVARRAPGHRRLAGSRARPRNQSAGCSCGFGTPRERSKRVRARTQAMALADSVAGQAQRENRGTRRRRVDDGGDARGVRERASRGGSARGTRTHSSASCRTTVVATSSATASGSCSPFMRHQPGLPACRW